MSDWGNQGTPPKKQGLGGFQTGLLPHESEALKQLSRTLTVIADMLDGIPLDRVLEDIAFQAAKKGYATKPFAHSPVRNRLLNVEKFALALQTAQRVARRDIKCVCGHGFSHHQTPGAECIGHTAGGSAEQEPSYCQCDGFIVHRYEYSVNRLSDDGTGWLPCLCMHHDDGKLHSREDIHPECPIHSASNDNTKQLVETWHR